MFGICVLEEKIREGGEIKRLFTLCLSWQPLSYECIGLDSVDPKGSLNAGWYSVYKILFDHDMFDIQKGWGNSRVPMNMENLKISGIFESNGNFNYDYKHSRTAQL